MRVLNLVKVYAGVSIILYHEKVGRVMMEYLPMTTHDPWIEYLVRFTAPIGLEAYLIYHAGKKSR